MLTPWLLKGYKTLLRHEGFSKFEAKAERLQVTNQ